MGTTGAPRCAASARMKASNYVDAFFLCIQPIYPSITTNKSMPFSLFASFSSFAWIQKLFEFQIDLTNTFYFIAVVWENFDLYSI